MFPILYPRQSSHGVWLGRAFLIPWLVLALAAIGCAASPEPPDSPDLPAAGAAYWPVVLQSAEGRVEIYQPQPEAMKGDMITARAAVSLTRPGASAPLFGAAWFNVHIVTDRDTRTVTTHEVTVKNVRLPGSTAAEQQDFARVIGGRLSAMEVTFPLDQLTASLDTARREQIEADHIETAPPRIVFSTTPATLVILNGPPRLEPVESSPGVSRVANTPFVLLFDTAGKRYYLKAGSTTGGARRVSSTRMKFGAAWRMRGRAAPSGSGDAMPGGTTSTPAPATPAESFPPRGLGNSRPPT